MQKFVQVVGIDSIMIRAPPIDVQNFRSGQSRRRESMHAVLCCAVKCKSSRAGIENESGLLRVSAGLDSSLRVSDVKIVKLGVMLWNFSKIFQI